MAVHFQLSRAQLAAASLKDDYELHFLLDAQAQTGKDFEVVFGGFRSSISDKSSAIQRSQDMLFYDINRDLNNHFQPSFDVVGEHTAKLSL